MQLTLKYIVISVLVLGIQGLDETLFKYDEGQDAVPDEYLVTLKKDILSSKAGSWLQNFIARMKDEYGCQIKRTFTFDRIKSFRVKGAFEKIQKLKGLAEVAFVEKNLRVEAIQATNPNTTVCYEQKTGRTLWGLSRVSRRDRMPVVFSASYYWGSKDSGEGVDAFVLDSGIDTSHPDFEGRARWGYIASTIDEDERDYHGHGTHVAGTVGGRTYGVAKKANLVAVKVLNKDGVGDMGNVIEGIQYAYDSMRATESVTGKKAKVVLNLSLGAKGKIQALEQVIDEATDAGMVIVVAAGNEFDDSCLYTPSHIASAITVGATNIDDNLAEFSNYGTCVDILAPGESILSAYPGGGTMVFQGTSMACPHVAGAVARLLSQFNSRPSPNEIKKMLADEATLDKINLGVGEDPSVRLSTPNRMLYMTCGSPSLASSARGKMERSFIIGTVVVASISLRIL